jgi:hypothetical protein
MEGVPVDIRGLYDMQTFETHFSKINVNIIMYF